MSVESCRHTERTAKWIHIFLSSLNEDLIFVVFKLKLRYPASLHYCSLGWSVEIFFDRTEQGN